MCGNLGLLLLRQRANTAHSSNEITRRRSSIVDDFISEEHSIALMEVVRLDGSKSIYEHDNRSIANALGYGEGREAASEHVDFLPPEKILEAQIAATSMRGSQGGGISSLVYEDNDYECMRPFKNHVRCVARRRVALSSDLPRLYKSRLSWSEASLLRSNKGCYMTYLGHTRFATSSVNKIPELHPHEWVPFHSEGDS